MARPTGQRDEANREIVWMLRDAAREVTGGNCTFADDDLHLLSGLAERAIQAGLTDGLCPTVLDSIARKYGTGKYAIATETRSAETENTGSVEDEGAGRQASHETQPPSGGKQ